MLSTLKNVIYNKYFKLSGIIFIEVCIILMLMTYQYFRFLPPPDININTTMTFYDQQGDVFLERTYPKNQHWVTLDEISPHVINGFVATEDKNFYQHFGFDFTRIVSALVTNLVQGEFAQGASTLTQQYAKNLLNDFDKTITRKLNEAFLTVKLELNYSKETLLEGYLNTIYFGHGNYGIEDASLFYFNKHATDLTLSEAAMLVAIPKGPSYYSPLLNYDNASARQKFVLQQMLDEQYITTIEHQQAQKNIPLVIGESSHSDEQIGAYFIDAVLTEIDNILEDSPHNPRHLKVYTTFDATAQQAVDDAIKQTVTATDVQTAVVVMDPKSGYIHALSGGVDFNSSQYNRALYSERQIGSMMKPFLYYAALEYGLNPSTTFISEPTTFHFDNGETTYSPHNYAYAYPNKEISMANAVAVSDNIYAVKLHDFLGYSVLADTCEHLGISTPIELLPSSILGTAAINMLELTEAYGVFANEGKSVEHQFITKLTDETDHVIYKSPTPKSEQLLDSTKTFVLNEMLTGMFNANQSNHLAPTAQSISVKTTRKYAGKTGTTDYDSWISAYNPNLITTVWVGKDDNSELEGRDVHQYAKEIWLSVMETSLQDSDTVWYETPNDVIPLEIDPISGKLAGNQCNRSVTLYYEIGNAPTQVYTPTKPLIDLNEEITVSTTTQN